MPLARYFLVVGTGLFALLLISSAYFAKSQVTRNATETPIIRISSDRKLPERIVFDSPVPTIIPPQVARTEATVAARSDIVADKAPEREAMAQLQPSDVIQLQPSPKVREPQPERRKIAKRRATPRAFRVARQSRFEWFGRGVW